MKKKPLSMKKLYSHAVDFLMEEKKDEKRWLAISQTDIQEFLENSEVTRFLDYVWKNRD